MPADGGRGPEPTASSATAGSAGLGIVQALEEAGQVGRDLLAVDWEKTPLGLPESWSRSLVTLVRVLVSSRFSMWMAWGPELTFFCNDAYRRDTLGKKYPWALGRPAREVWAEIWPDIGPRIETVLRTGTATWDESLLLFLERSGFVEETYHTFSYSPLTDDSGAIVGMLCVVSEDTERVIGERHLGTLRDLASESATGRDDIEYLLAAGRHLEADSRSLPFTLTYLFAEDGSSAELACSTGIGPGEPAAPESIASTDPDPAWPIAAGARGRTVLVEELERRFAALPSGAWDSPPTSALLLPLPHPTQLDLPYGFLVVGLNPFRPVDEDYRSFLGLLAVQLASGIASARAYEAERRRAEELAELDRAKTAFFTNVSHELRTPLTLLLAPAEDALADADQSLPDGQRERVEMIVRNGQRLLKLVGTLLDFSRLESRTATALFERTELGHYTAELASMFEAAIRRAGLEFRIECPPLPEPVYVDREMWAKIVLNLLSNALKFTFSGEIAIRVDHHDAHARLSVSDTGIGVEPAEQAKLFERFHRVLGARGRTHEGSGIGLALVAELAVLHGGRAGVESTPGVGSTFTVEVPFGQDHVPADQLDRDVRPVSIEREVAGFLAEASRWLTTEPVHADADGDERDERPRVLVVDDNADMRDYVTSLLATDYSVQTAPDGQAALELARAEPPDLVLTDVMMPRLDGFGLLAALQADPQTLHVPVVMLSARAGEEGVIEGLEAGADDYLIKPFSGRELRARVQANLELDRARRTREQLESSQRMQNEAERLAEVGSWEIDLATGAARGSEQLLRLVGLPREEFESLTYDDVIARVVHPEDHDAARAELEAAVTGLRPFEHELRLTGDPERILRVRGEIVADEDGAPVTLRGFAQDITRDKQAEQAIAAAAAAREAAEREHAIADSLQRSLLPADVLDSDQLKVATYYQAGVEGTRVGGDWYDAIELGAGRTALVIGDVAGRGVRAASVMGQLRAAVRAYAQLDLPPGELLERLDTMVCELVEGHLVTCIYGVYDPAAQELRYGNAGHLPPVLARPGQPSERLPSATDPPLGARAGRYTERRIALAPGSLVVLYTDGLVERRRRPLDDGIDTLADLVVADDRAPAELASVLIEQLAAEGTEDDIAILIARATEDEMHRVSVLDVPPDASAVHEARSFAETTMRGWDVPRAVIADAALVISELLTNAIVHGRPPIRMRLHKTRRELAVEVDDGDSAMPRKLYAAPEDVRGRGLFIVGELSSRWAARADGTGKTVWSTLALPYDEDG